MYPMSNFNLLNIFNYFSCKNIESSHQIVNCNEDQFGSNCKPVFEVNGVVDFTVADLVTKSRAFRVQKQVEDKLHERYTCQSS